MILISGKLFSQEADKSFDTETKSFLAYLIPNFFGNSQCVVVREAAKISIKDCKLSYESVKLNPEELNNVRKNIASPKIANWTSELLPQIQIIDAQRKKDFQESEILEISSPIFLRNYQVVLIKIIGNSAGYEGIFIKTDKGWDMDACSWDN